jgi:hypothetical protein
MVSLTMGRRDNPDLSHILDRRHLLGAEVEGVHVAQRQLANGRTATGKIKAVTMIFHCA